MVYPNKGADKRLRFDWPQGGESFAFDLGGRMLYGDYDDDMFVAEVKKYQNASDLGTHYKAFLAKCYVAYTQRPQYLDHFLWVSWSPHSANSWDALTSCKTVRNAVIAYAHRIFDPGTDPEKEVDDAVCQTVADRLWLLVVSDKQETLVPTVEHLNIIHSHERTKAAGL